MSITKCNNNFNTVIRIPEQLTMDGTTFKIIGLGGFANHTELELLYLPDTLQSILGSGFSSCKNLFELKLPSELKSIGTYAFQNCTRLKELHIPASVNKIADTALADCSGLTKITVSPDNPKYIVVQDCLIDMTNKVLVRGLATGQIPDNGVVTELASYCFSSSTITDVTIPEGITKVTSNAFSHCDSLINVKLPSTLKYLDATCFAWCNNLKNITLPDGLEAIYTYVFYSCSLEDIVIPASVQDIKERAFGGMSSLKSVTFKKQEINGEIVVPKIDPEAFADLKNTEDLVFNLPWSAEQTPNAPWGAVNCTLNFDYEEVE